MKPQVSLVSTRVRHWTLSWTSWIQFKPTHPIFFQYILKWSSCPPICSKSSLSDYNCECIPHLSQVWHTSRPFHPHCSFTMLFRRINAPAWTYNVARSRKRVIWGHHSFSDLDTNTESLLPVSGFVSLSKHLQNAMESFQGALMMKTVSTSETSVNFYPTTRRNISEDSHLNTCRRENLKSHLFMVYLTTLLVAKTRFK
jgi:hypothetical protein